MRALRLPTPTVATILPYNFPPYQSFTPPIFQVYEMQKKKSVAWWNKVPAMGEGQHFLAIPTHYRSVAKTWLVLYTEAAEWIADATLTAFGRKICIFTKMD